MYSLFYNCKNLVSIPEDLFYDNPEITSFQNTFLNCSGITEIPENLFSYTTRITTLVSVFDGTSISTVPEKLLSNIKTPREVTNINGIFSNCASLVSIPEYIFADFINITVFSNFFFNCSKLTIMPKDNDGTPVYNRSGEGKEGYAIVTNYVNAFRGCTSMEGYDQIPADWK